MFLSDTDPTERFVTDLTGCQDRLFACIFSLLPDVNRARDVLQETNLVLWRKQAEFDPDTNFDAWASRVAQLQVRAAWRDLGRERGRVLFDDTLLAALADDSMAEANRLRARIDALRSCMAKLPREQQRLIRDRYESGGSVVAIARAMNRSANAVSISLHRVRKVLTACISQALAEENRP